MTIWVGSLIKLYLSLHFRCHLEKVKFKSFSSRDPMDHLNFFQWEEISINLEMALGVFNHAQNFKPFLFENIMDQFEDAHWSLLLGIFIKIWLEKKNNKILSPYSVKYVINKIFNSNLEDPNLRIDTSDNHERVKCYQTKCSTRTIVWSIFQEIIFFKVGPKIFLSQTTFNKSLKIFWF